MSLGFASVIWITKLPDERLMLGPHHNLLTCTWQEGAAVNLVGSARAVLDAVPYGWVDAWNHYVSVTFPETLPFRHNNTRIKVYGRADLAKFLAEYEEVKKKNTGEGGVFLPAVQEWAAEKEAARIEWTDHVRGIEQWEKSLEKKKQAENAVIKVRRAEFFQDRARALDPPLDAEALNLIPAYKRAVEVTREPTERAWRALLPKLLQEAEAAQKVIADRNRTTRTAARVARQVADYRRRQDRRIRGDTVEQQLLGVLAAEVLDDLEDARPAVADADYPLLALHSIHRKYYKMADAYEAQHDCPVGYRLLLEDARWLFYSVIGDRMSSWGPGRSLAAKRFKCPGCTRLDMHKRHSFDGLFVHLRAKHAVTLGDFRSLMREGLDEVTSFRWLDIEWPANLPILAEHHTANGRWNPDSEAPYQQYVAPTPPVGESIWEGRKVATEGGPPSADLVPNIVYAGELFRNTPLNASLKTSIVLRYALDKRRAGLDDPDFCPPLPEIEGLPVALMQAGMFDLFDKCRCAACVGASGALARDMTKLHTAGTLIHHFHGRHTSKEWSKDMMVEPDWIEAAHTINDPSMAGALAVFDQLFPRTEEAAAAAQSKEASATSNGANETEREGSPTLTPAALTPSADHGSKAGSPDPASMTSLGFSPPVLGEDDSRNSTPADDEELFVDAHGDSPSRRPTPRKIPIDKSPDEDTDAYKSTDDDIDKPERFGARWQSEMERLFSELADQQELQTLRKTDLSEEDDVDDEEEGLAGEGDGVRGPSGGGDNDGGAAATTTLNAVQQAMDGLDSPVSFDHGHDHAIDSDHDMDIDHDVEEDEQGFSPAPVEDDQEDDDDPDLMVSNSGGEYIVMVD